jgi:hypothetical protein
MALANAALRNLVFPPKRARAKKYTRSIGRARACASRVVTRRESPHAENLRRVLGARVPVGR